MDEYERLIRARKEFEEADHEFSRKVSDWFYNNKESYGLGDKAYFAFCSIAIGGGGKVRVYYGDYACGEEDMYPSGRIEVDKGDYFQQLTYYG